MPHWQLSGIFGVCAMISEIGYRDSRRTAMKMRGITREVERHVALVATARRVTEVLDDVGGPLVGLAQQHPVGVVRVDLLADPPQELVRPRQVLAVGPLLLEEVRHRVEPEPVDAEVEPEPQRVERSRPARPGSRS